uniref:NADH-ubiquinone oxidoreductase chain 6 n=1 Tax=Cacodacnus planicollis TaxID=2546587 RepID=A0A6H0N1X0_9CUCU|nr:NADH dehydrogenase subunit 6 [Cacodacnus planicollis]
MILTFIMFSLCLSSIIFILLDHPLSFGFILLTQTLMISLATGMLSFSYWFSYILFLIMVGGMLVLFIYMTSVASNEKFKFSIKILSLFSISIIVFLSFIIIDKFLMNTTMFSVELINQNQSFEKNSFLSKFFNWPLSTNMFMIIIYLLITLIMVVKITNIQYGPLRQKF